MKYRILVYGDSLGWGIIPGTRSRYPFDQRWPGILELELQKKGKDARIIEDCLNGRRTVCDDPFKPGRNGLEGLETKMEVHSPLSLVIVCLGTNDFQTVHNFNAELSAAGLASIVNAIRRAPVEPGMPVPPVLLVAPPDFLKPKGDLAPKFENAVKKSTGSHRGHQGKSHGLWAACFLMPVSSSHTKPRSTAFIMDAAATTELIGKALAERTGKHSWPDTKHPGTIQTAGTPFAHVSEPNVKPTFCCATAAATTPEP